MKCSDIFRHISGGNDEVLKSSVGVRVRNAGQYPKECGAEIVFGLEADAAGLCAGNQGFYLNMNKLCSFAITAEYIGAWRVPKSNNCGITSATQLAGDEKLT